jgi:hypothetical protein
MRQLASQVEDESMREIMLQRMISNSLQPARKYAQRAANTTSWADMSGSRHFLL